jgi:aldehyde dehydrogenase (NAD+)
MAAAARTLASVTLELGGRSPAIVAEGADIAQAARWIAWGKFLNAGQTCIAPDHVHVHEDLAPRLIAALRAEIRRAYGPDPRQSPDLARIVSAADWARLTGLVDEARTGGAEVLEGGQSDAATRYVAPTLIAGATPQMALLNSEIFGPVLPILTFRDLADPVAAINAGERPLALYVFGDRAVARRVVEATSSGSVGINLTVAPFVHPNLPFGGVGHSGLGAAHGETGFRAFSHEKPVLANRFSMLPLVFPPYGPRVRRVASWLRRIY